jgi:transposase IS66-like protein
MWPLLVVITPPGLQYGTGVRQRFEQRLVQQLVAQPAVEAFDEGVLHLPRERVVIPGPSSCPCCGGKLAKLGETITETLEVVSRQWKVIQTVRKKFTCRSCEKITQPPAPFQ